MAADQAARRTIGILGGAFNPVHIGHLRTGVELRAALALDELRFMPCAAPPHRQLPEQSAPGVTARHRLAMLRAAIDGEPGLAVDDREIRRAQQRPGEPSYSIDTLIELRRELGPEASICMLIGMDALVGLSGWRRWRELLDYAHIVVAARPGWRRPEGCRVAEMVARCAARSVADLRDRSAGLVWLAEMTLLPVSSTQIRDALRAGSSVRYLLPEPVIGYIRVAGLYI